MNESRNDIYNFRIGQFNCAVINDGFTEYATADMLFGTAPKKELEKQLHLYDLNPGRIKCYGNCLLINDSRELILIDAGFGLVSADYPGAGKAGKLVESLKNNGYNPEDIGKVIFTHYHTDHIGGAIDEKGNPVFPEATVFMNIRDWRQGTSIESYGKKVLLALEAHTEFFDSEIVLSPGIKAIPAPGHTAGHTLIKIESDNEEFLNISDLAAHQIHFENPEWSMAHEYNPDLAAKTRREIFGYAADKNIPILTYHLPFPGLGYLHKKNNGWDWRVTEL